MEYIYLIDKDIGEQTGDIASYDKVHEKGLWHRTVHVWVSNSKNEILLQHRAKNKKNHPDMWDISAAGHISAGESPLQAVLRETEEEIGLKVLPKDLKFLGTVIQENSLNNGTYIDNEFQNVYLIKADVTLSQLQLQKEEVQGLKWIKIEEFEKWVEEKKSDLVPHFEEYNLLLSVIKDLK